MEPYSATFSLLNLYFGSGVRITNRSARHTLNAVTGLLLAILSFEHAAVNAPCQINYCYAVIVQYISEALLFFEWEQCTFGRDIDELAGSDALTFCNFWSQISDVLYD